MAALDSSGRMYATHAKVRAGDWLEADGDFTCLNSGDVVQVRESGAGDLFVPCREGRHFLDGQEDSEGNYVGLYPADRP